MKGSQAVWEIRGSEPRETTVSAAVNVGYDFFMTRAEAWEAIADKEAREAEYSELCAEQARQREKKARDAADAIRHNRAVGT